MPRSNPTMAATKVLDARVVGERFAALIKDDPDVCELWARPVHDYVKLWLITRPLDVGESRKFYRALMEFRDVTGTYVDLQVLNPIYFEPGSDLREELPTGSVQIP
jgi:hypothetical protein